MKKKKTNTAKRACNIIMIAFAILILLLLAGFFALRSQTLSLTEETRINLHRGATYEDLVDSLKAHDCLKNYAVFHTAARLRGLPAHVKPGSYTLKPSTSVFWMVQKFYSGNQDPIHVTINKQRTPAQLCDYLSEKLDFESDSLLALLQSDSICSHFNETPQTILGMFLQNTYEVYWTISPMAFLERMHRESEHFWDKHEHQLSKLGLTQQQVITIASIVDEETNCNDEKPDIASVYLNRYRIGMPLQADPTVKFALGDFSIRRILNYMLDTDSPYNTYRYKGLPPGPICIPSTSSIESVLKNKKTDYIFFCAKEDFSGKHNFASNSAEHAANANKFHKALNERNIK